MTVGNTRINKRGGLLFWSNWSWIKRLAKDGLLETYDISEFKRY